MKECGFRQRVDLEQVTTDLTPQIEVERKGVAIACTEPESDALEIE